MDVYEVYFCENSSFFFFQYPHLFHDFKSTKITKKMAANNVKLETIFSSELNEFLNTIR